MEQDKLRAALVQHMRAGLLVEGPDGCIVTVNPAFCQIFGIEAPPELLEGTLCAEAAVASSPLFADAEGFRERLGDLTGRREAVFAERILLRDGRVLERDYIPLFEDGAYLGTFWQYVDVTAVVHAQDTLRDAKEVAERANEAKTQFLATLSHEIRTPLNAVLGMTSLALGTVLDVEQRGLLRSIRTNSEALIHLLSDILDFTKIESGKMELDKAAFDLASLIEEVAEVLAVRAAAKDVELVVDVFPDLPARVIGDPNRTRQVLMNLVGNAVKYTIEGRIIVRARRLSATADRTQVRIEVEDTGPGMPPSVVRKVFDRFFRGQLTSTEGTGLGLAISRQLVELMGGKLQVHSQLGVGSTFFFDVHWPVARSDYERRGHARQHLAGRRVLVDLEDPSAAWAVSRVLESVGLQIASAEDDEADLLVVDEARVPPLDGAHPPTLVLQRLGARAADDAPNVERLNKPASRHAIWESLMRLVGTDTPQDVTWDLSPVSGRRRGRILVVEDNLDNQRVAVSLLERGGHRVDVAPDGQSGLRALADGGYDLALLDIDLPDISGLEVARRARAEGTAVPPLLAFTAHASEQMRAACLEAGMDAFLAKPVAPRTLLESVAHWLGGARKRVLVADDAPDSRKLLCRYLDGLELDIEEVDRGSAALARARRGNLDLLVLDVEMPGTDGREVLAALRQTPHTAALPVILVTGHDRAQLNIDEAALGPLAYLRKPVRLAQLVDEARAFLDAQAPPGEAHAKDALADIDEDVKALLPGFARRGLESLDEAKRAAIDDDLGPARTHGHRLKGTGTSYGLPKVTALGGQLEAAANDGEAEAALRLIGELRKLLEPWA